jgi:TRAP-type C4-dicarboxylate transport system permease small subunit
MSQSRNPYERTPHLGWMVTVVRRIEDGILVSILTLMIGVAAAQILLRNLFGVGIIWGDVLVRVLVLWTGLVGAMIATRQDKHISIDLVTRYLPRRFDLPLKAVVQLFAAGVCALAAFYSFVFVQSEYLGGGLAFGQVPVWVCEAVMPLAFAVMALRYIAQAMIKLDAVLTPNTSEEPVKKI